MIELALVLPVFALLFFGVAFFGRLMVWQVRLTMSAHYSAMLWKSGMSPDQIVRVLKDEHAGLISRGLQVRTDTPYAGAFYYRSRDRRITLTLPLDLPWMQSLTVRASGTVTGDPQGKWLITGW